MAGYYKVCIDNTPYRFTGKLVYIYIVTYVIEEWAQYMEEIQSVSLTAQNFSVSSADHLLILDPTKNLSINNVMVSYPTKKTRVYEPYLNIIPTKNTCVHEPYLDIIPNRENSGQ